MLPSNQYFSDSNKSIWLSVLYLYRDREVDKNEIADITRHYNPDAGRDQQVRHLKRDGWNIGDKPGVHRLNPFVPSAEFIRDKDRRRAVLGAGTFEEIKEAFDYRCATCGAEEGKTSPRYGDAPVKLQKAHRDPFGAGDNPDNIIPQCQYCNRAYLDDWVFDKKGRAHSIASVRPVARAREVVQLDVLRWLKNKFHVSGNIYFR